jgi:mRNA interferase RelE/StbE
MAWKIELSPQALKNLTQLDQQVGRRILKFLHDRLAPLDDPRSIGEALRGSRLGEFWKYRVGDYRVIASIEDGQVVVFVLRIGNRREVYRERK